MTYLVKVWWYFFDPFACRHFPSQRENSSDVSQAWFERFSPREGRCWQAEGSCVLTMHIISWLRKSVMSSEIKWSEPAWRQSGNLFMEENFKRTLVIVFLIMGYPIHIFWVDISNVIEYFFVRNKVWALINFLRRTILLSFINPELSTFALLSHTHSR